MARKATLEAEKTEAELAGSEDYAALLERIEDAKHEADDALGDVGSEEGFVSATRELFGEPAEQPEEGSAPTDDPVGGEENGA